MSDGLLSQEEIDALLNGVGEPPILNESDKDLLGEIGNISMGSASTALSTIIGKMVNITTPKVTVTTLNEMKQEFSAPIIALEVLYTEGLGGANLLLMKMSDAAIIADLMMGGTGEDKSEVAILSEIEISAVSEAMNQMIGSSATSLSTMLSMPINISPPVSKVWDDETQTLAEHVNPSDQIVKIAFKLTIDELIDSEIMLLLSINTAKAIINKMTGGSEEDIAETSDFELDDTPVFGSHSEPSYEPPYEPHFEAAFEEKTEPRYEEKKQVEQPTNVQRAQFAPLTSMPSKDKQNIDLILDVPLEISVVLGRTKKTIKEILELGTGSLVELDKLTEEPVEILVNGKKVALGEVVVIDENFGVRITSIVNSTERVKSLQGR
jgi:flagellar motor switch protein FliN